MADTNTPEPQHYIRTFAKDLAAASGTPVPPKSEPVVVEPATPVVPPVMVSAPQPQSSPVAPPPQEPPPVPGEFWYKPETPPSPVPSSVNTESDREAILARLREKLAQNRAAPEPIRPLPPEVPPSIPVVQKTAPAPVEQPVVVPPKEPERLHTYSSDFSDKVDQTKASTFSVLAAASDAGQVSRRTVTPMKRSRVPLVAGIAAVTLLGGGGIYVFSSTEEPAPIFTPASTLLRYDESEVVTGTGAGLVANVAGAAAEPRLSGSVLVYTHQDPSVQMFLSMFPDAPSILARNIEGVVTVGSAGREEGYPFLAIPVSSYERTFAGMLAWEPTLYQDVERWYPVTGTSTTAVPFFVDAVVRNKNVRVLRDGGGKTVMLYGYADRQTLLIARDETAFGDLLDRVVPK
jgi:hypothetical protein